MHEQNVQAILDLALLRPGQGLNLVDQVVEVEFGEAPLGEQRRLPRQPRMVVVVVAARDIGAGIGARGTLEHVRPEPAARDAGQPLEVGGAFDRHLGPLIDGLARDPELACQLGDAADLAGRLANDREHGGSGNLCLSICQGYIVKTQERDWKVQEAKMESCEKTKRVLAYCKDALNEIKTEEATGRVWERRWASLMALFRTACEVLRKEAPLYWKNHLELPNACVRGRDAKNDWQADIFGKFIWADANLFLHRGTITAGQSRMVPIQGVAAQGIAAGQKAEPLPPSPPPPPPITSYHMNTEPYKGCDPRDVADQAILWLEQQIDIAEK